MFSRSYSRPSRDTSIGNPWMSSLNYIQAAEDPSWSFHMHTHEKAIEISFVFGGKGSIYYDGRLYHLETGDIVIKNPGVSHAENSDPAAPLEQVCLVIEDVAIENEPLCTLPVRDYSPVLHSTIRIQLFKDRSCGLGLAMPVSAPVHGRMPEDLPIDRKRVAADRAVFPDESDGFFFQSGDSQIEMDRISGNLRSWCQSKFGGGGPGLLPAIQTVASYAVSQSASGPFTLYSTYGDGARAKGNYGLMLKCYRLTGSGTFTANATSNKRTDSRVKRFSRVTLLYNDHDGKFRATLSDRKNHYDSTCTSEGTGIHAMHWQTDSSTASLRINMQGTADIYGIMIDNGPGVSVDNIPLRSSSGNQFTLVTDTILRKCYQLSDVGLIILQFGGNQMPSTYSTASINKYCTIMQSQIRRIKSVCPNATLLFIGPSDMSHSYGGSLQTYTYLPAMVDSLRNMCLRNHVAYWDLYEVMGGRNSMVAWVKKGWAGPDYVHFTPAGANYVGKTLAENFATMYELYTTRRKMGAEQFDNLWEAAQN